MTIRWITVNPDIVIRTSLIRVIRDVPEPGHDPFLQRYGFAWPLRPSPLCIVAALDARLREHEQTALNTAPLDVDGYTIPLAEAFEVRRQLLAAMVKASDDARREADRRMVLGPIDDPDDA